MSNWITPIAMVILVVAIPYVVNLCKKSEWTSDTKRWLSICCSIVAGLATAFLSGAPTPDTLVTWVLAVVGGVQISYTAFKSIGITSNWLDALEGIGSSEE